MTREDRKRRSNYRRIMRPLRRKLRRAARDFEPFDDGYLFDILEAVFDYWIGYYGQTWNVICADVEKPMPRFEIAKLMKEKLDAMTNIKWDFSNGNPFEVWQEKTKEFFDFMAEYIHYMWD